MWLIDTTTLQLEAVNDPEEHNYAILSHTWEDGEINYQEIADLGKAKTKPGFSKIERTCQLARDRGIKYAWIDTCCIDKSSSAELTEAINSMFRWYKMAAICFVFLSDLPLSKDRSVMDDDFPRCRWFTRGWTLQELIAAKAIEFYDREWNIKGDKISLRRRLSDITNIDVDVLEDSDRISTVPVARRMSWAAKRRTKRLEDLSYCLFGIFDVNLPLIYGEGSRAFIRLQEAIAADNNDLSLFAWTSLPDDQTFRGLFAKSPSEFDKCGNLERVTDPFIPGAEFALTNKGVHMTTRLQKMRRNLLLNSLNLHCLHNSQEPLDSLHRGIGIWLLKTAHGYVRYESDRRNIFVYFDRYQLSEELPVYIPKVISPIESRILSWRLSQCFEVKVINVSNFTSVVRNRPEHLWNEGADNFITNGHENFNAILEVTITGSREHPTTSSGEPWSHESKYIVVLGLEKSYSDAETEGHKALQPWASIYKDDGKNEVSRQLFREKEHGFPQILARVGRVLRMGRLSGPMLPTAVETTPISWYTTKDNPSQRKELMDTSSSIELHVSTEKLEENNGPGTSMYEVVLTVDSKERCND